MQPPPKLQDICQTILNNADLTLSLDSVQAIIRLDFVYGLDKVVTFFCEQFSRLHYEKLPEDTDALFVGETHVAIKKNGRGVPTAYIKVDGGITLNIICAKFSWRIQDGKTQTEL